jgi:ribosomal protein L37AE/L43A
VKPSLVVHVNTVHSQISKYSCELCDYSTNRRYDLEHHSKVVHLGDKDLMCDQCDKTFTRKVHLARHVISKHENQQKINKKKIYKRAHVVNVKLEPIDVDHQQPTSSYNCELCDFSSYQRSDVVKHFKNVHAVTSILSVSMSSYNCEFCDFSSDERSDVVTHSKTVHVAPPSVPSLNIGSNNPTFQCDMCDMTFAGKTELGAHKDILHKCSFTFVNVTADNEDELMKDSVDKDSVDEDLLHTGPKVKIECD